jgi:nitrite reductase/ring-hydroxylating ferredoxin subunit
MGHDDAGDGTRIASTAEVAADTTLLFTVRPVDGDEEREAVLIGTDDGVRGWLNYCRHLTHVRLDKGSGAPVRDDELVCTNHGAMFETDTGVCTFGPCEGAVLDGLDVAVRDGAVHLVDDGFALVGRGPVERDPVDRGSTSNVEF